MLLPEPSPRHIDGAHYFGLRSKTSFSDAADDNVTQLDRQSLNDDGRSEALIANVLFGVAAAGLAAGGLLLFVGGSSADDKIESTTHGGNGEHSSIAWGVGAWGTF